MTSATKDLRTLNIEIGHAETRGDRQFFEELLAPAFAMRRVDGVRIDDRAAFLDAVAPSAERETEVESITVFEGNRALITCVVSMISAEGTRRFHNVRLFTRQSAGAPWCLLAWANERM